MPVDASFLEQLKELNFVIRKKVSSVYAGGRPSIQYGRGIEPVDHREYFPGDDFRLIDWRLYGRTERLYIRRFEEEKNLILHILVDSSASMDFQALGMKKFDYAGSIAAGLGYLAINNNEKFAIALYSDRLKEILRPEKGKMHLFRAIEILNTAKLSGQTNLEICGSQYAKMIKSKSFMTVISDFLEPIDSLKEGIYRAAKHSKELTLIQVLDPTEISLRWSDDIKFEDLETSEIERTFLSPDYKKRYKKAIQEHVFEIQSICDDVGADFFSIETNRPIFESFVELVGGGRRNA